MTNTTAIYLPAKRTIRIRKGAWSIEISADDLPRWLALYRTLRDRKNGAFREHYVSDVAALEAVQNQIRGKDR